MTRSVKDTIFIQPRYWHSNDVVQLSLLQLAGWIITATLSKLVRHIDFTVRIATLTPDSLAIATQWHHKTRGTIHVLRSHVQIDLDAAQKMLAGLVEQGMSAG